MWAASKASTSARLGIDGAVPGLVTEIPALNFLRFRPPRLERTAEGVTLSLPHIRLDQALQYLIGDKLA